MSAVYTLIILMNALTSDKQLVNQLGHSRMYADYERAFSEATQLPMSLRPLESWQLAHEGKKNQNPFCLLMAKNSRTCAACLELQGKLANPANLGPATATCFAGLTDSTVPVHLGERTIGFLQTGQVALEKPTEAQFKKVSSRLAQADPNLDLAQLKQAYFQSPVLSPSRYEATLRLLEIFAQQLSTVANQVTLQAANQESPVIRRVKAFIAEHQADPLTLREVAKFAHMSVFHFCKTFKKSTGLTFTDYLGRVRIEKAKSLLLKAHLRVSEIAYDVGFQSLTHFNRLFSRLAGCSPSAYRASLAAQSATSRH